MTTDSRHQQLPAPQTPVWSNEITNLRAISVLAVVIYHLWPGIFPGGFLGVDIFFVISGFVISKAYLHQFIEGSIKFHQFLIKRIRRLFPAAFVMLLVSTVLALLILEPPELALFARSLMSQVFYTANIHFWLEGDYFHHAYQMPLLHTWSLAVEEQFYLVFPVLILLIRNYKLILIIVIAGILSTLLASLYIEPKSPRTVFYLTPFRAWELLLGVLTYLLSSYNPVAPQVVSYRISGITAGRSSIGLVICLIIILLCFCLATEHTETYLGYTLIACFATACMLFNTIHAHNRPWFEIKALSWIGDRSYSIYLWHWPLIVFAVYHYGKLSNLQAIVIILVSFAISHLVYALFENPIRRYRKFKTERKLLWAFGIGSIAMFSCALFLHLSDGLPQRYSEKVAFLFQQSASENRGRCSFWFRLTSPNSVACEITQNSDNRQPELTTTPGILIIGDSHADAIDERIARWGDEAGNRVYLTASGCDFWHMASQTSKCGIRYRKKINQYITKQNIRVVIMISSWFDFDHEDMATQVIDDMIKQGLKVIISGPLPYGAKNDPSWHARKLISNPEHSISGLSRKNFDKLFEKQLFFLLSVQDSHPTDSLRVILPHKTICDEEICHFYINNLPAFTDSNHLSEVGINKLWPNYEDNLYNLSNSE